MRFKYAASVAAFSALSLQIAQGVPSATGAYVGIQAGASYVLDEYDTTYEGTIGGVPGQKAVGKKERDKLGFVGGLHAGYAKKISKTGFWALELAVDHNTTETLFDLVVDAAGNGLRAKLDQDYSISGKFALGTMVSQTIGVYAIAGINAVGYDINVNALTEDSKRSTTALKFRIPAGVGGNLMLSKKFYLSGEALYYVPLSSETVSFRTPLGNAITAKVDRPALEVVARLSYRL